MGKVKIISVVGARPNFMKIAPFIKELKLHENFFEHLLVHTGQHYDKEMSESFFNALDIPEPDYNLGIKSNSPSKLIAEIMVSFEDVCVKENPDLIVVVGDVNSTVACSLVANKLGKKVAHIEAGLRSFDENMPEEINRMITDRISDYLFVSEESGLKNLSNENILENKVHFVGNIMIDSLMNNLEKINSLNEYKNYELIRGGYIVLTLHRPSNVDSKDDLIKALNIIEYVQRDNKIIWPLHPRTRLNIKKFGLEKVLSSMNNVLVTGPLGYLEFMSLVINSKLVLTDSGGIQEETTYLGIPCITLRENTERPSTITQGSNKLVGLNFNKVIKALDQINSGISEYSIPKLWDGGAAKRVVDILLNDED